MIKLNTMIPALILGASLVVSAQTTQTPQTKTDTSVVDSAKKNQIDTLNLKIENFQLKKQLIETSFQNLQTQYQQISQDLLKAQSDLEILQNKEKETKIPEPAVKAEVKPTPKTDPVKPDKK